MKLTPWFPKHVKPRRIGIYSTSYLGGGEGFSYWDGSAWWNQHPDKWSAKRDHWRTNGANQRKSWRGLAKEPK